MIEQFAVIHVIDLICGNDQDILGVALLDHVKTLEHCVRRTPISFTVTRRQTHYFLAVVPPKLITKLRPAFSHVRMKAFLLVLSQHINAPKSRVQRVR